MHGISSDPPCPDMYRFSTSPVQSATYCGVICTPGGYPWRVIQPQKLTDMWNENLFSLSAPGWSSGWSWLQINPPAATLTAPSLSLLRGFSGERHVTGWRLSFSITFSIERRSSLTIHMFSIHSIRSINWKSIYYPFIIRAIYY